MTARPAPGPRAPRPLATFLVNELYASVDVGEALGDRVPGELAVLAGAAAGVLRDPLVESVEVVLPSPAVRDVWRTANREVHEAVVALLRDDVGPATSTAGGAVTIDLGALVEQVALDIGLSGERLAELPDEAGVVTVVESDRLASAQAAVRAIEVLGVVLFVLVLALYGLAVPPARGWPREAVRSVGAASLSGFLLLVVVRVASGWVVDEAATATGRRVTSAVLPIATDLLQRTAWAVLLVGVEALRRTSLARAAALQDEPARPRPADTAAP